GIDVAGDTAQRRLDHGTDAFAISSGQAQGRTAVQASRAAQVDTPGCLGLLAAGQIAGLYRGQVAGCLVPEDAFIALVAHGQRRQTGVALATAENTVIDAGWWSTGKLRIPYGISVFQTDGKVVAIAQIHGVGDLLGTHVGGTGRVTEVQQRAVVEVGKGPPGTADLPAVPGQEALAHAQVATATAVAVHVEFEVTPDIASGSRRRGVQNQTGLAGSPGQRAVLLAVATVTNACPLGDGVLNNHRRCQRYATIGFKVVNGIQLDVAADVKRGVADVGRSRQRGKQQRNSGGGAERTLDRIPHPGGFEWSLAHDLVLPLVDVGLITPM